MRGNPKDRLWPNMLAGLAMTMVVLFSQPPAALARNQPSPDQLRQIVETFGSRYDQAQGKQFAEAVLHPYVMGMDGGKYRDYQSMHRLISETWAGMSIRYEFLSIRIEEDGLGIVEVHEHPPNEKWRSTFIFTGGQRWRLIQYRSERL